MTPQTLRHDPLVQALDQAFAPFPKAGVFLVGGAVRDALSGHQASDLDVVVTGLPIEELERIVAGLGPVDLVGKRFAVLKVRRGGRQLDVALPRTDASYGTGRYRDVEVRADPRLPIEQDLARRDFTVNAMAWDVRHGRLIDPYHGQRDLERRVIQCVGDPSERFQEDATRLIRAVRFAVQLRATIDTATASALNGKLNLLIDEAITPREVIARELVTAFRLDPIRALDLSDEHGLINSLLPEVDAMHGCVQPPEFHSEGDVWTHTHLALAALMDPSFQALFHQPASPQLVFTTLLHDIGKAVTQRLPVGGNTDRIRFDGHAPRGAELASQLSNRLRLASAGIDGDLIAWAIQHHLDVFNLESMRPVTLERTFLTSIRGPLLLQLIWADSRASLSIDDVAAGRRFHEPQRFSRLMRRLQELRDQGYRHDAPAPLLNGSDVMRELDLRPGPEIGAILDELRDAQLDGRIANRQQAVDFLHSRHAR